MPQCPPATFPYAIRPGDNLYAIARRFNTTLAALISANPFLDPNALPIGMTICVPQQPIYPPCPERNFYTLRPGDTLSALANFFTVSLDDLIEANPGIDPERLFAGQVICIPLATPPVTCPPASRRYLIQQGDTFFSIARRFNISVESLARANRGINPNALLIGQAICVPIEWA
ncbi:LysM peptidoglycan-binding domain-containing protein [Heliobacterium undosum]|uniref:LysM peptidoglycan-binding domain-containing protein n=1 Tax=Heliomicrobium undosum TaxID=121734 RepID=A0A845L1F6_9FIRM|nr:LysM domain-containing protein [Heliomicrobium undosum]MZP28270.1 LysM peptidoglycan-binding domain-containing protein [Heliomicrobium undosum]